VYRIQYIETTREAAVTISRRFELCSRASIVKERLKKMKEGGAKQRYSSDTMFGFQKRKWNVWAYLLGGGIASRHPRTTQHIKNAKTAERVTISHWPRTTTGLSTGVRGTENAGTAFTSLNCLCTTLLSMRVRVCCGKSRCGREEESRLSRGRRGTFSSG
jgi:hypothetical protein